MDFADMEYPRMEYPRTFRSAAPDDRDGTHFALFHAHHPLVAFVAERRSWYVPDAFLDPPARAATLTGFGFAPLARSQLLLPLHEADTSALTVGPSGSGSTSGTGDRTP
ncbi:hypothetical protein HLK59_21145 [Streptomyces sp. S3(2020)]|uniref:hypothetical protein n=1 Tax=Streptomyces sp. S3(2020) TaxID=2732044 RepID=UPI0014886312|nr:hypothetical protein [Streptomyces sp. S3(2020)]NNN32825.1 hypothetical protein [Streptomyces sp. S3(2020)]